MKVVVDSLGLFVEAFATTLSLTLLAAVGALILGTLIAAMRVSPVPPLQWVGRSYVRMVRNTPLPVVFFMVVFGLPEVDIVLSFYVFAVIALMLYTASFVAEAVRSGINAVPVGQAEAARSIGLTFPQTLRIVLLPQALRTVIPPLASIFIALLKNSSIASAFGVAEAISLMQVLANDHASAVLAILFATAAGYVILALGFGAVFSWLERRLVVSR
ncbi:MAG: amino acid ABC transporter permease [Carbonactinosporaceae bacterium]